MTTGTDRSIWPSIQRVLVVGAGQAGAAAVKAFRAEGFTGSLTLVGGEDVAPYERPPLSKDFLLGRVVEGQTRCFKDGQLDELATRLVLGATVDVLSLASRRAVLSNGEVIDYDLCLLTTGASPRRLCAAGEALAGVHTLRTLADAQQLRASILAGERVVIIGGGLIGLEVAAAARQLGKEVVVIEMGSEVCGRALPAEEARWLREKHVANGVRFELNARVEELIGSAHLEGVRLADGRAIQADVALICVGVLPNDGLARAAGLEVSNGVHVDVAGRTSDPHIFAAGDVANFEEEVGVHRRRYETWGNAQNRTGEVVRAMLGREPVHAESTWFWTHQYDTSIQVLGHTTDFDVRVVRQAVGRAGRVVLFLRSGRLAGAITLDCDRELRPLRKIYRDATRLDPSKLRDIACPLADCALADLALEPVRPTTKEVQ